MGGQSGCERRSEVIVKIEKKSGGGGVGSGGSEQRIEVFVKIKKSGGAGGGVGSVRGRVRLGVKGGCERRSEVIVKIPKKIGGGAGWGVRVDVNKEVKLL